MKLSCLYLATLASIAASAKPGYVQVDLIPQYRPELQLSNLLAQNGTAELTVANRILQYTAHLGIGTPPQYVGLIVDTGSSDMWVAASAQAFSQYFNPNLSSTFVANNTLFAINYVRGAGVGTWATDNIILGDVNLTNLPFGAMNQSFQIQKNQGTLGIGPISQEITLKMYPNFPRKLKDQGYIRKVAYSAFLDSNTRENGTLLFGAVDSTKYVGNLYTVPMSTSRKLDATLSRITVNGVDILWNPVAVPLDIGSAICFLPPDAFIAIAARINDLHYVGGAFFADSLNFDFNQTISFDFSGATINVAIRDMLLNTKDIFLPAADIPLYMDLVLGIFPNTASAGINTLGNTFLRSAYVVYDLEANEISLAQANMPFNKTIPPVITPIVSMIPGALPAPGLPPKVPKTTRPLRKSTISASRNAIKHRVVKRSIEL